MLQTGVHTTAQRASCVAALRLAYLFSSRTCLQAASTTTAAVASRHPALALNGNLTQKLNLTLTPLALSVSNFQQLLHQNGSDNGSSSRPALLQQLCHGWQHQLQLQQQLWDVRGCANAAVASSSNLTLLQPRQPHQWTNCSDPAIVQWHQQQRRCYSTNSSSSASSSSSSTRPKSSKGSLPGEGPSHKILKAIPFLRDRAAAAAAFSDYHSKSWYQSKQRPALHKPFKESYLPFWVGSGSVQVEVRGAEVGHEHLVTRYNKQTGRAEPRWETVWSRVSLQLGWVRELQPEDKDMQVYASWKYFRRDVQALAPGQYVTSATAITPDMLQASAASGLGTRRVGPFTVDPVSARRLVMATIESQERRKAEEQISKLLGASQVRFVDMHCTWHGSTGAASSSSGTLRSAAAAAAAAKGGLDLSPVYVPAYVFSWWHGGTKVRTFVSAVDLSTSGVHVLDDTKLATLAATTTATLGLLSGVPLTPLFWGGVVLPFFAAGLVARFWPLIRTMGLDLKERFRNRSGYSKFWQKEKHDDYCEVDWNASFVHSYDRYERRQQQQEQRQSYWQAHRPGGDADPFADFQQIFRDPLGWFEKMYARQQQQQQGADYTQQQRGSSSSSGQEWQQQYKAHRQQAQYERSGPGFSGTGGAGGAGFRTASGKDPRGYYKTLGVEPGCTTGEVQAAFRGLALQHHPDRYTSAEDKARATKRFQQLTEAYQVLRDPKKRGQYDAGMMA